MRNGRGRHTWARERPFGAIDSIFRSCLSLSPLLTLTFSLFHISSSPPLPLLSLSLSLSLSSFLSLSVYLFLPFPSSRHLSTSKSRLIDVQHYTPIKPSQQMRRFTSPMSLSTDISPRANRPRRLIPVRRIARGLFLDCHLSNGSEIFSRRRWQAKRYHDEYWNQKI